MFHSSSTTKGKAVNFVVLVAAVVVGAVVAAMIVKIKKDPKNPDGYRNTLAFKK